MRATGCEAQPAAAAQGQGGPPSQPREAELEDGDEGELPVQEMDTEQGMHEGVPFRVLENAFGPAGSWTIFGAVPPPSFWTAKVEEPYALRDCQARPSGLTQRRTRSLLRRWGAAVVNSKGNKAGRDAYAAGQDNFCIARLSAGWEVFAVFDGHGAVGHWPSARLAQTVPVLLQGRRCSALLRGGRPQEALQHALEVAQDDLKRRSAKERVDLMNAGSTALVVLRHFQQEHVWAAHVGDSRAVLICSRLGAVAETSDHRPDREDERARVEASGGAVKGTRFPDGSEDARVYVKGTAFPGIAVSRSLGDYSVKGIGVIGDAEVVCWPLRGLVEAYVLLGTDGVFEFQNSADVGADVVRCLRQGMQPQEVLKVLLARARQLWKTRAGAAYCDDITMVLAPLMGPQAPRWHRHHFRRPSDANAGCPGHDAPHTRGVGADDDSGSDSSDSALEPRAPGFLTGYHACMASTTEADEKDQCVFCSVQ